eukprot:ctg_1032.g235
MARQAVRDRSRRLLPKRVLGNTAGERTSAVFANADSPMGITSDLNVAWAVQECAECRWAGEPGSWTGTSSSPQHKYRKPVRAWMDRVEREWKRAGSAHTYQRVRQQLSQWPVDAWATLFETGDLGGSAAAAFVVSGMAPASDCFCWRRVCLSTLRADERGQNRLVWPYADCGAATGDSGHVSPGHSERPEGCAARRGRQHIAMDVADAAAVHRRRRTARITGS